ncbi:hypothetical protein SK128_004831 [Halocaridina rubra]|uniref:Aftiphilin clathrin-binding box domain-containing protein n=1 Tax=Halocaridina rubra TaxID=373956 RepID=A0AAN9A076_HALRR
MAFQMIPPRVSSSPPPLDSLPSVACPGDDDEDEEFGNFSTHNTFDITGLSDKLPPTPESSPSKYPNLVTTGGSTPEEAYNQYGIEDESLPGSSVKPRSAEDSKSSYRTSDINGELITSLEGYDDSEGFGDFSHYNAGDSTAIVSGNEIEAISEETGEINSSHIYNVDLGATDDSPSDSGNSYSVHASPPPLDHIADNIVIEDEFSRISPNLPPNEEEFGDFEGYTYVTSDDGCVDATESSVTVNDVSDYSGKYEGSLVTKSNGSDDIEKIPSSEGVCTVADQNNESCAIQEAVDTQEKYGWNEPDISEVSENKDSQNDNESKSTYDRTSDLVVKDCKTDLETGITVLKTEKDDRTNIENNQSLSGFTVHVSESAQTINNIDSRVSEQDHAQVESISKNSSSEFVSCKSELKSASKSSIDKSTLNERDENVIKTENIENTKEPSGKDMDSVKKVNTNNPQSNDSCAVEPYGEDVVDDDDFGEFSKPKEDDDDLDFDDLREQVRNGTFGLEASDGTADDYDEIYEYRGSCPAPDSQYDESEDFGNFGSAGAVDEDGEEFGDFAAVGSDGEDFGDFAVSDKQDFSELKEGGDPDDEFGDFTSQQGTQALSNTAVFSWNDSPPTSFSNDSPVLRKLETLLLKWIPKENAAESQENHIVPTLFQLVEDDAFVWRQLENLESSTALTLSWGSMQAQTLYLSSVNVDARNIVSKTAMITLFGQKWSSSVPLFAQTLSFSPLTPAKPTESGATLEGGSRGPVTPPVMMPPVSTNLANFSKDSAESQIPVFDENESEEQIPPAKFDWTSSGLINPLEGPGLEKEFLSEGAEKGARSRLKSPPTPSPLVQQILGSGMNRSPSATTPLQSLSTEARDVVENLPDLGFMRSRVLMFPIRGDE